MAAERSREEVELVVGDRQIAMELDLGVFLPRDGHQHPDRSDGQEAAAADGQEACDQRTRSLT
jgi:hypothetical protein